MPTTISRPIDATLSVTKAARLLGVHPNTIRAWSDAGRLRYYRINPRGDRRYRLTDLQRFLAAAAEGAPEFGSPFGSGRGPGPGRRAVLPATLPDSLFGGAGAVGPPRSAAIRAGGAAALAAERRRRRSEMNLMVELGRLAAASATAPTDDLDAALVAAARVIRDAGDHHLVVVWERRGDRLAPRAVAGPTGGRLAERDAADGILGRALAAGVGTFVTASADASDGVRTTGRGQSAAAIPGVDGPWGVLLVTTGNGIAPSARDGDLVEAAARSIATTIRVEAGLVDIRRQLHRAEVLRRVAADIGSRLDLDQILTGLAEHAAVMFEGDRAAVFLRRGGTTSTAAAARGLSHAYLTAVRDAYPGSLAEAATSARRPLFATNFRDDPRARAIRAAVIQEGYDTICTAPIFDGLELLGLLSVYHDRAHPWSDDELETMAALVGQAGVAIKNGQNYSQMATWAAQLQSIQQLGARLSELGTVGEIGLAIANELRELIDYHNVRVYRLQGDELVPVAMQGRVGEYVDETPDQLGVKLGEGITGWVAEHRLAQNLANASADPRADTIPGTEPDMDESMLLAPMLFEEQVFGVLVLSKLGLDQFTDDDLRLLVIYASFAAQAMANADATERLRDQSATLERQLRSQRALLQITESILTTLDARSVLDQIADRLVGLIGYDNLAIEIVDPVSSLLRPLTARGAHAEYYLEPWEPGETGIATWVVEHNEPVLIVDERNDTRVNHFREDETTMDGSLIVVPLRDRDGAAGVLTLERLGVGNVYNDEEFELVKLFAAQVSIALQNAEIHTAVEIRARTDDLTSLFNHGAFRERLASRVLAGDTFSLIMIDLDDFKGVNDALGHQAGDRLLAEIGQAIVAAGRDTDSVFRYGGDEFTVLLPGADADNARGVAERVQAAIHAVGGSGSAWQRGGISVRASLGVATFPTDGQTADEILLAADRACFVAKRTGRGRIATGAEGLALAAEFSLQDPTPVDSTTEPAA